MKKRFTYLILLVLVLSSCGTANFQKQKFTNLKHLSSPNEATLSEVDRSEYVSVEDRIEFSASDDLHANEVKFSEATEFDESEIILDDDCGDRLTFKSGAFLKVKIIQVNKNDVVYRRCDDLNGPAYTVIKDDLAELKYAHGGTEDLKVRGNSTETINENEKLEEEVGVLADGQKPIEPFALVAFICSLSVFLYLLGIIFGIVSLVILKRNPDQYRKSSRIFAMLGIGIPLVLGLIGAVITLLLIFLL